MWYTTCGKLPDTQGIQEQLASIMKPVIRLFNEQLDSLSEKYRDRDLMARITEQAINYAYAHKSRTWRQSAIEQIVPLMQINNASLLKTHIAPNYLLSTMPEIHTIEQQAEQLINQTFNLPFRAQVKIVNPSRGLVGAYQPTNGTITIPYTDADASEQWRHELTHLLEFASKFGKLVDPENPTWRPRFEQYRRNRVAHPWEIKPYAATIVQQALSTSGYLPEIETWQDLHNWLSHSAYYSYVMGRTSGDIKKSILQTIWHQLQHEPAPYETEQASLSTQEH